VNVRKLIANLLKLCFEERDAPLMGTQFRQISSVRSWIKIKPGVWKCCRKRLKTSQCLKTVVYALKFEMYRRANKIHLCAQNRHSLKYNRYILLNPMFVSLWMSARCMTKTKFHNIWRCLYNAFFIIRHSTHFPNANKTEYLM